MTRKRILNFAAKCALGIIGAVATPCLYSQNELYLQAILPPGPTSINAQVVGAPGATVRCYFVVANYPGGSVVNSTNPACVTNANNTLTSLNFVNIGWTGVSSGVETATTYDVIVQTQTGPFPVSGTCTSCSVATGLTGTTTVDNGGALGSYTFAGFATPNPMARIRVNNYSFPSPQITFGAFPIRTAGYYASSAVNPVIVPYQISTQTAAVTLTANQMVNGVINGIPAGGVNYQSDTASNLCTRLGRGTSGSTGGMSAEFYILNKSAGANTISFTTNTGITLSGTITISQNVFRQFRIVATSCAQGAEAVTIFALASGTF